MPAFSTLCRYVLYHRCWFSGLGLLMVASLGLLAAVSLQRDAADELQFRADQLRRDVGLQKANLAFFKDSGKRLAEVAEMTGSGTIDPNEAMATIPAFAKALGIRSVAYNLGGSEPLWESSKQTIEQTALQFQLETLHEGQVFEFLETLEANWGGRFFIERLKFSRAAEGGLRITTDVTLQWRKLQSHQDLLATIEAR